MPHKRWKQEPGRAHKALRRVRECGALWTRGKGFFDGFDTIRIERAPPGLSFPERRRLVRSCDAQSIWLEQQRIDHESCARQGRAQSVHICLRAVVGLTAHAFAFQALNFLVTLVTAAKSRYWQIFLVSKGLEPEQVRCMPIVFMFQTILIPILRSPRSDC